MALIVNVCVYMICNILLNILLFTDFESKRARRRFRSDEKYINILFSILLEGETESLQTILLSYTVPLKPKHLKLRKIFPPIVKPRTLHYSFYIKSNTYKLCTIVVSNE